MDFNLTFIQEIISNAVSVGNRIRIDPINSEEEYEKIGWGIESPFVWNDEEINEPSHLVVIDILDTEGTPYAEYTICKDYYLIDSGGNCIAEASIFSLTIDDDTEMYWENLEALSSDFDVIREDWNVLFQHSNVVNITDETELVVFVENLKVEKTYRGRGYGKCLLNVVIQDASKIINRIDDLVEMRVAMIASPIDVDFEKDTIVREQLVVKLLDFYRYVFTSIEDSKHFEDVEYFTYKVNRETDSRSSVIVWTAGGKPDIGSLK